MTQVATGGQSGQGVDEVDAPSPVGSGVAPNVAPRVGARHDPPAGASAIDADARIAALERVIRSLSDELASERKRHAETADVAETHKSWATELFAELSVLKRRLEAAPEATQAQAAAETDAADPVVEPPAAPVATRTGHVVDRLRPLTARPVRSGLGAAFVGALLAVVVMSLSPARKAPVSAPAEVVAPTAAADVANPPVSAPTATRAVDEAPVANAPGTATPASTPVRVDDATAEPVRMSIDIGGGAPTNAPKPETRTKPAFDRVAAASVLRQSLDNDGMAAVEVRVGATGRVALAGVVDTAAQKERAASIARSQPGVRDVANAITVRVAAAQEASPPKIARELSVVHPTQVAPPRDLQAECEAGTNLLNRTMKSYLCMKRLCRTPELASHPQCVEFCDRDRSAC